MVFKSFLLSPLSPSSLPMCKTSNFFSKILVKKETSGPLTISNPYFNEYIELVQLLILIVVFLIEILINLLFVRVVFLSPIVRVYFIVVCCIVCLTL